LISIGEGMVVFGAEPISLTGAERFTNS